MKRILALDWGEKCIGVAFTEGFFARPYTLIHRKNKVQDYQCIKALIQETEAELLLIGFPQSLNPDQPIGPQAKLVLNHVKALSDLLNTPVEMANEQYSTVEAKALLRQIGKKNKTPIDAAAAAVILQNYLDG